jgi:2-polyprenyl-3-methyl-5-hydroxy-6-metoxy-1,4-benzoquinol methylase
MDLWPLLIHRFLSRKSLQRLSQRFWSSSTDTCLASPEYYERRARVLGDVLAGIGRVDSALDLGCGDGRFTRLIAEHARHVDAFDLSPSLIDAARRDAPPNLAFAVADLDESFRDRYDLVACMGVLACLHDEAKYLRIVDSIAAAARRYVLLIDTVSLGEPRIKAYKTGYVGNYRNVDAYARALTGRGFALVRVETLSDWTSELTNRLWLFRLEGDT